LSECKYNGDKCSYITGKGKPCRCRVTPAKTVTMTVGGELMPMFYIVVVLYIVLVVLFITKLMSW